MPLRAFSEFLMCFRESLIFFFKNLFSKGSKKINEIKEELKDKCKSPKRKFLLADVQVFPFCRYGLFWEMHQVLL